MGEAATHNTQQTSPTFHEQQVDLITVTFCGISHTAQCLSGCFVLEGLISGYCPTFQDSLSFLK